MVQHAPRKYFVWARLGAWHQVSIALCPVTAGLAAGTSESQVWMLGLQSGGFAAGQLLWGRELALFRSCGRGRRSTLAAGRRRRGLLVSGKNSLCVQPSLAAGWRLLLTSLLLSGSHGGSLCIILWGEVQKYFVDHPKPQLVDGCHLCWGKRGAEQLLMVGLQGTKASMDPKISQTEEIMANTKEA